MARFRVASSLISEGGGGGGGGDEEISLRSAQDRSLPRRGP